MLGIWRFYKDGDAGWKWQRLSINKVVMAESRMTFGEYAECVADAARRGYQPLPSQEKLRPTFGTRSYNRPYVPLAHPERNSRPIETAEQREAR
jgi:hypothetical protein